MSQVHRAMRRDAGSRDPIPMPVRHGRETVRPVRRFNRPTPAAPSPGGHRWDVAFQRLAQAVRGCWTGSQLFDLPLGARVLLVVSSVRGEGASVVARDLAARLSEANDCRVLLVDANLRRPTQHTALGVQSGPGLTDLLHGDRSDGHEGAISQHERGFAFLPCGHRRDNPAQFLGQPETTEIIRDLSAQYDWIVIDGPPVIDYPDAAVLAGVADGAILVVKAEATRQEVVAQAKRTLTETGVRILGAVLNRRRFHIPEAVYRQFLRHDSARSRG